MNYIWVIFLIASSLLGAYCAKLSNSHIPYGSLYVFLCSLIGMFIWVWLTRVSKNLIFDSLLFDIVMTISFTAGFVLLKYGSTFHLANWIGLAFAVLGLMLMKI
jgi:hypothetical protein